MFFTILIMPLCILCYLISKLTKLGQKRGSIKAKHVLIIGGSSGIGKALAIHCTELGANVTIVARNTGALNETLSEMNSKRVDEKQQLQMLSVHCNVFEETRIDLQNADSKLPVDMLVCCAGKAICGTFDDLSVAQMNDMININLYATLYPIKALVSRMKGRRTGTIVITGSQGGQLGLYGYSVYAATKFALRGLAESLHMELHDFNISVTLALPPDTDTPGFEQENKSKPLITQKLSETGGLVSPHTVAKQLLHDALEQNFLSYVGLPSFVLTTLTIGMAPFKNLYEILFQALLLGPLRLIGGICLYSFHSTISQTLKQEAKKEKTQ